MPDLHGLDAVAAARLVIAVGAYRALHERGPSWRAAARAASWRWEETRDSKGRLRSDDLADRMHTLRGAGLVVFDRTACSLDTTPAGRRWALETIRRSRETSV